MPPLQLNLDFRSRVPIYAQIIEQVKAQIATGALQPGDQLPTVRQMASDLRVNFNTVARAYRLLDDAGLISTQHGRGTYILSPPPPEAAERFKRQALEDLSRSFLAQALRLGITPAEIRTAIEPLLQRWESAGALPDAEQGG